MAAPFGFSAGDFIAAIHLVHKISTALRDTNGAGSEYRQTIFQLDCLEGLLRNVQRVYSADVNAQHLDLLRLLARECYIPLNKFLSKIKFLESSLGKFVPENNHIIDKTKRAARKVQWGLQLKKELSELMMAIGPRIEAINTQMLFIIIECQQKTGSSQDILLQRLNDLNSQMRNLQRSLDIRIDSLATMTSMENVSQTLQGMKLEAKNYHNLQIDALSKRTDVQAGCLDLKTSQQVLDAIHSLTSKPENHQAWSRTKTIQIAAHLEPESKSCSIDHSGSSCDDQVRMKRMEDQLADQKQQLQLLIEMCGKLQSSGSRPEENSNATTQDVQETIHRSIQTLISFFRAGADVLFMKLWIVLPVVQHIFSNLQAPRLLVSLTIGDSIVFEDVLGCVVHLPYKDFRHYTVFIERLRCEFEGKPGKNQVLMNQFRIFRHGRCDQFLTQKNWNIAIRPGSRIAMSIVLSSHYDEGDRCPRCKTTKVDTGTNELVQCTLCGLSWALQKLDSPYTSSGRRDVQEVTSILPLPRTMRDIEGDEHSSLSTPLPDPSRVSSHSVDDKDIEKFRIVHIEKMGPSADPDATFSIASSLERIGFSLHGSFPWKRSPFNDLTVEETLRRLIYQGPSDKRYNGSLYIFSCKGSPRILKIGRTYQNVGMHLKQWIRMCGPIYSYDPELYNGSEMRFTFASHVEKLIHAELSDYQLCVKCSGCLHKHYEFFYVSKNHVMRVIQKWKRWMLKDPYMQKADGKWQLKPSFWNRVDEMCRPLAIEN